MFISFYHILSHLLYFALLCYLLYCHFVVAFVVAVRCLLSAVRLRLRLSPFRRLGTLHNTTLHNTTYPFPSLSPPLSFLPHLTPLSPPPPSPPLPLTQTPPQISSSHSILFHSLAQRSYNITLRYVALRFPRTYLLVLHGNHNHNRSNRSTSLLYL